METAYKATYNVGIYCRLSKDDNNIDESASIQNQKTMLTNYCLEKGWNITAIYADDGFTGTNFDRPDFKQMIRDIKDGKINLVLTKDLSRLGRNYVLTGQYTESFFPDHGVRFIAVNDNIDSINEDNDIAPFKNILNEYYAKDISRKVRSTRNMLAQQGKFGNSRPPYGYIKSPDNKYQLIIDEAVADNVRRIFKMFIEGKSGRYIADIFNQEGIPTPNTYFYDCIVKKTNPKKQSSQWGSGSVMRILKNPAYKGDMAQCKRRNLSYKSKKTVNNSVENWVIVENTHEPIVSKKIWEEAQKIIQKNSRTIRRSSSGEISLFSGIVKCADCGVNMTYNRKYYKSYVKEYYRCGTYTNKGKTACSCHTIRQEYISQAVLSDLRQYAALAYENKPELIDRLISDTEKQNDKMIGDYEKQIKEKTYRKTKIVGLIKSLFEEKINGNLSEAIFKQMVSNYEKESLSLEKEISSLNIELDKRKKTENDISEWVEKVKECLTIHELTRELVVELIDCIEVSEVYTIDGEKHQDIKIIYRFDKIEGKEKRAS